MRIRRIASIVAFSSSILLEPGAAFANKIPPPPPISLPVWSLAVSTRALQQQQQQAQQASIQLPGTSMNIVTFCSAVSVEPPKLWIVSLYYDTLTKDSFMAGGDDNDKIAVLQLLRPAQKDLVPVLGKQSGYNMAFSKRRECMQRGFPWVTSTFASNDDTTRQEETMELLPDCATYIYLKLVNTMPAGDHVVALCQVIRTDRWDGSRIVPVADNTAQLPIDSDTVLYTGLLRQEGIL
jgi:Flavin reductase like domain